MGDDLTLEKLKIDYRLQAIERAILDDQAETKLFRDKLDKTMDGLNTILLGDGKDQKGLAGRTGELELRLNMHTKGIWIIFASGVGLLSKGVWDLVTGGKHG